MVRSLNGDGRCAYCLVIRIVTPMKFEPDGIRVIARFELVLGAVFIEDSSGHWWWNFVKD